VSGDRGEQQVDSLVAVFVLGTLDQVDSAPRSQREVRCGLTDIADADLSQPFNFILPMKSRFPIGAPLWRRMS